MNSIYDAIRERENQIAAFQAQISDIQVEIEALRVAARIMEESGGKEAPRPMPVQPAAVQSVPAVQPVATVQTAQPGTNNGGEKKRVWP